MSIASYDWYIIGILIGLTVVSLITRAGYFIFGDYLPLPDSVRRALRYAPVAALTAIILPELFPWSAQDGPGLDPYKLIAAFFAVLAYWRTRSAVWLMVIGMAVYWLCRFLI